ncbi:hypothetical protein DAPPUDRAFT_316048 [Daphnia pulex]|uniref:Transmembrane protein n=1 Tax=Daphnia pulex TaxID=6669 RepID=E9GBJ4_DAPPU|nr:hypothetical protein DAPPUDRAFT_316048 [Daphnia pulex]|eukprot:EFX82964.1 hypothetical protein DAPPUDRAFT_316048 [Daphnia pulex]
MAEAKEARVNIRLSFMEDESTVLISHLLVQIAILYVLIVYFWVCIDAENSGFIMIWCPCLVEV